MAMSKMGCYFLVVKEGKKFEMEIQHILFGRVPKELPYNK
jgi:hypothetical protein